MDRDSQHADLEDHAARDIFARMGHDQSTAEPTARRKRRPARFTHRDLARAIKAAIAAGLAVGCVRIAPDGTIEILPGKPQDVPSLVGANDWD